jgi:hypothetical protein
MKPRVMAKSTDRMPALDGVRSLSVLNTQFQDSDNACFQWQS